MQVLYSYRRRLSDFLTKEEISEAKSICEMSQARPPSWLLADTFLTPERMEIITLALGFQMDRLELARWIVRVFCYREDHHYSERRRTDSTARASSANTRLR